MNRLYTQNGREPKDDHLARSVGAEKQPILLKEFRQEPVFVVFACVYTSSFQSQRDSSVE
jgi:hypothetical protein